MMLLSVAVCIAAFVAVAGLLRMKPVSPGLPIANFGSLLLIVSGAVVHLIDTGGLLLAGREFTRVGIGVTAIGPMCFVIGVWFAHDRTADPMSQRANRAIFSRLFLLHRPADVFAMPGAGKDFGIVLLSSMACGTPVVAGNRDGSVYALHGDPLGQVVGPRDISAITDGINPCLKGKDRPLWFDRHGRRDATIRRFGQGHDPLNSALQFLL